MGKKTHTFARTLTLFLFADWLSGFKVESKRSPTNPTSHCNSATSRNIGTLTPACRFPLRKNGVVCLIPESTPFKKAAQYSDIVASIRSLADTLMFGWDRGERYSLCGSDHNYW